MDRNEKDTHRVVVTVGERRVERVFSVGGWPELVADLHLDRILDGLGVPDEPHDITIYLESKA